ncbi:MAG: DNA methyltransferase, partial [Pseudomonadota bacterium]
QSFALELCDVLDIPKPDPAKTENAQNDYVFERAVKLQNGDGTTTPNYIDLYHRDHFVMEAKQGSDASKGTNGPLRTGTAKRGTATWEVAMQKAWKQAQRYARALHDEGHAWPPLIVVTDVGYSFDFYSDFSRSGRTYIAFPDPRSFRIPFEHLEDAKVQEQVRLAFTDPGALDPSRKAAEVTREVSTQLAKLARSLEASGHAPRSVAEFLMRCLFTMFAEDVDLIPENKFTDLLVDMAGNPKLAPPMLESLWRNMNTGGFDPGIRADILRFNGGLFADHTALPLTEEQMGLLIAAAKCDWREVEPAIFGTLLERALSKEERHKLGAHYTPRAYVERLVVPTVIDPLREDWEGVKAAATALRADAEADEKKAKSLMEQARETVRTYHATLCETRVLDPACGSGNFLYIAMEHMKRLEGEVIAFLDTLGDTQASFSMRGLTIDPHNFLGMDTNPWAARVAESVLWIGYLQWHLKTRGKSALETPLLRDYSNITQQDAVLAWDGEPQIARDEHGQPITVWDGVTMKTDPVTGREVPDEIAQREVLSYPNARKPDWPEADFIVSNPPFLGTWRMRGTLGHGYTETLREIWEDVPESVDFVMYWWHRCADLLSKGAIRRFGLITTNSLRQTFARRVIAPFLTGKKPISLAFAIPDHPWVDSADGAAVRIAMTLGIPGEHEGVLAEVLSESGGAGGASNVQMRRQFGRINSDLTVGVDTTRAQALRSNGQISSRGVVLH